VSLTPSLVAQVVSRLGGQVEELARAVDGALVLRFDAECAAHIVDGGYLQLGLGDTSGGGGGVHVRGGERGGGEVAVLAAHGVGGGGAGDEEAGEDGDGLGDGRHFDVACCGCVCRVGWWWLCLWEG
jgi:hypothetical protein